MYYLRYNVDIIMGKDDDEHDKLVNKFAGNVYWSKINSIIKQYKL